MSLYVLLKGSQQKTIFSSIPFLIYSFHQAVPQVSQSTEWPQTHCVAEGDYQTLHLPVFIRRLLLWMGAFGPCVCGARGICYEARAFLYARKVLCQMMCIPQAGLRKYNSLFLGTVCFFPMTTRLSIFTNLHLLFCFQYHQVVDEKNLRLEILISHHGFREIAIHNDREDRAELLFTWWQEESHIYADPEAEVEFDNL